MAQKRMFDKSVVKRDEFLEMPDSSQVLYFQFSMDADDDGFLDNWKSIMRMCGKKEDDLKILIAKSFVIPFSSGIIVIKHWRINNYLRGDRYKSTKYLDEKKMLNVDESGEYSLKTNFGIPVGNQVDTNGLPSIDESSIDKNSIDESSIYIYKKIQDAFNEIDGLAKINVVTNTRKKKIDARLKEFNEEIILQAIAKIKTSNFLKGENKSGWKITFDWLMANDTNLMKVLEGNFDNRKQKGGLDAFKEIYKKFDEEERENEK